MHLRNTSVLVTGASSGIGQAIAIELARAGAFVIVNYRSNKAGAEETLARVKEHSDGLVLQADFGKPAQVKELFATLAKQSTQPSLLVNNAGEARPGELGDLKTWEFEWNNIFMSAVHATNAFLQQLEDRQGRIINISSIYGNLTTANPQFLQYSAAKAALNNLTKNLAKSLGPNVLVNAVAPGYTWTPAWEGTPDGRQNQIKETTQIKRFIEPEEIASVVRMLAENDSITGEIITVDGGVSLTNMS